MDLMILDKVYGRRLQSAHDVMGAPLTDRRRGGEYHRRTIERPLSNENVMSVGRTLAWFLGVVVIGGGLYFLLVGNGPAPEMAAPAAVTRAQIAPPAPMPAAEPSAEALAPAEALGRDAAAAEEKIKQDQEREIREMPAAPADMGMSDKDGIEKDAQDAAKAAGKKP